MSEMKMLPVVATGECGCADCRAERGDTQFAEFMGQFDAYAAGRQLARDYRDGVQLLAESVNEAVRQVGDFFDTMAAMFRELEKPPDGDRY